MEINNDNQARSLYLSLKKYYKETHGKYCFLNIIHNTDEYKQKNNERLKKKYNNNDSYRKRHLEKSKGYREKKKISENLEN